MPAYDRARKVSQGGRQRPRAPLGRGYSRVAFGVCAILALAGRPVNGAGRPDEVPGRQSTFPAAFQIQVELSAAAVEFVQAGRPGLLGAQQEVEMRVTCGGGLWSVSAQATPLLEKAGSGEIEPDRLFVRSAGTRPEPDAGAGPGFVPLSLPVVVAEGTVPLYSTPLEFRLLTGWGDTPGTYEGQIQFTAVVRP